jgi:integrase/recombinase XerD
MTSLLALVKGYLTHRRRMGYQLHSAGTLLVGYARFCERAAPGRPLRTELALRWANARPDLRAKTRAQRLGIVRGFAQYCAALDPRHEVPPSHLLTSRWQRRAPHLFTASEVRLILRRAKGLETDRSPLQAKTYPTLLGLLICAGLRPGEALRLRLSDFDERQGSLRIAPCKFSPERTVPLHGSCVRALVRYRQARWRAFPFGENLFVAAHGRPLKLRRVEKVFRRLTAGIPCRGESAAVRLYDFRHTFATRLIAQWSRQARPIAHHLLLLARYLGHRGFLSTWWYVSSDPKALRSAACRFQCFSASSL